MSRRLIIVVISFLILFSTGCWDLQDVSERAFITGVIVDSRGSGESLIYRVTFVSQKPIKIREKSYETFTNSFTTEAPTFAKAIQKLQTKISRNISFFHLRTVIIGEKLGAKGIRDVIDFIEKSPEIALRIRLLFFRSENPESIVLAKPSYERTIIGELVNITNPDKRLGLSRANNFLTLIRELDESKGTGLGTKITLEEDTDSLPIMEGAAVIKNWRLVGWLNGEETQGANWFNDRPTAVIEGKLNGGTFSYFVDNKAVKIKPKVIGNQISFTVQIKTIGLVGEEKLKHKDLSNPKTLARLEKVFEQVIKRQVENAIRKSQNEFEADYLGFGKVLKSSYPKDYEKINWQEVYPTVPIEVNVKAKISRYGVAK